MEIRCVGIFRMRKPLQAYFFQYFALILYAGLDTAGLCSMDATGAPGARNHGTQAKVARAQALHGLEYGENPGALLPARHRRIPPAYLEPHRSFYSICDQLAGANSR